ncbi:MAG: hypothetical protein U9P50_03515 [Patescibacteria group bacterium]|nr:hypothetical protein [Patescibacteria group bacterium]
MDEQNQEYRPEETAPEATTAAPEKKQTGSIIGSIIVIIVIIIGGLYFWGTRTDTPTDGDIIDPVDPTTEVPIEDPIGDALNNTSPSDNLDAIEADLNATDINTIDSGAEMPL